MNNLLKYINLIPGFGVVEQQTGKGTLWVIRVNSIRRTIGRVTSTSVGAVLRCLVRGLRMARILALSASNRQGSQVAGGDPLSVDVNGDPACGSPFS